MAHFLSIALMFLLDRVTKLAVIATSGGSPGKILEVFPFLNIVMVWNTGVSFSLFAGRGELGRWLLVAAAIVVVGVIVRAMIQAKSRASRVACAMIVAGAIGNIWDRVQYGAVADFLDFHLRGWHFPAFNVADTLICLGVFMLLVKRN